MNIKQGDIILADMSLTKGHEQSGFRPVVVLQNDNLNEFLTTVVVAPLTSNLSAKGRFTTFFLASNVSGLSKDSVVLLFQARALDKIRFKRKISSLDYQSFVELRKQLYFVF